MALARQEREVIALLREVAPDGVTPRQILERLDQLPPYLGRTRKDGKTNFKMPGILVHRIRRALGKSAIHTIINNGVTRYYLGEI